MSKPFYFKQFSVHHNRCAMKVGTDGVLLGAWSPINGVRALDVGAGSGLISLMLAQRDENLIIDAIELDSAAATQGSENFKNSPWADRLQMINKDILNFQVAQKYDIIVANPPFFIDSTPAPSNERDIARNSQFLTVKALADIGSQYLDDEGLMNVIYPPQESALFQQEMEKRGFYLNETLLFKPRKGSKTERKLMSYSRKPKEKTEFTLYHYDSNDRWSEGYKDLTKDFYTVI